MKKEGPPVIVPHAPKIEPELRKHLPTVTKDLRPIVPIHKNLHEDVKRRLLELHDMAVGTMIVGSHNKDIILEKSSKTLMEDIKVLAVSMRHYFTVVGTKF